MGYDVGVSDRARRDLSGIYLRIGAEHSEAALEWWEGLRAAILGLEKMPNRCAETPERAGLRQLLFGKKPHVYRVIFRVLEGERKVEILHIRHGARQGLGVEGG